MEGAGLKPKIYRLYEANELLILNLRTGSLKLANQEKAMKDALANRKVYETKFKKNSLQ